MAVYQSQIKELYMPKISERKAGEMERLKDKINTEVRATKPRDNYLEFVYEQNKGLRRKSTENLAEGSKDKKITQRSLHNVASHKNLGSMRQGSMFADLERNKKRNKNKM